MNKDLTYQLTVQNNDTFIQINYNGNTYTNSKGLRIKPLKKVSTIGSNFLVLWYMFIKCTFLSNKIVQKISFSLCFWASDHLIDKSN